METLTYAEFKTLEKKDSYYKGRWPYFNEVISIINNECSKSIFLSSDRLERSSSIPVKF